MECNNIVCGELKVCDPANNLACVRLFELYKLEVKCTLEQVF